MIYTITFNPAIDLVVKVPNCELGTLNRSVEENYVAGGKGINMSVILKRLGFDNTATGFLAGFSGNFIKEALQSEGIGTDFIQIDGVTRINLKLKSNEETEINANGPVVTKEDFGRLVTYFEQIVNYAKQLQQMGARNVLISRGGNGAMLITETGEVYTSNVPKGTLVNSVGAGDSMLSGFMAKFIETGDYAASLRQGAATGSATAFSVGIAEKAFIEELLPQVVVTKQ